MSERASSRAMPEGCRRAPAIALAVGERPSDAPDMRRAATARGVAECGAGCDTPVRAEPPIES